MFHINIYIEVGYTEIKFHINIYTKLNFSEVQFYITSNSSFINSSSWLF